MVFKMTRFLSLYLAFLIVASLLLSSCASNYAEEKQGPVSMENLPKETEDFKDSRPVNFILGVGDTIEISVYKNEDLKEDIKIDFTGATTFPLIGDVRLAGRSITEVQQVLTERYSEYIIDPQVGVRLTSIQSQKVIVLGEVRNPGVFPFDRPYRVTDLIATAGGLTEDAKTQEIAVIRQGQKEPTILKYDLESTLAQGDLSSNIMVQNGDIIYVPVTVLASVSRVFAHLGRIIYPLVALENVFITWPQFVDAISGTSTTNGGQVIITAN